MSNKENKLNLFFYPESVAVIGVSPGVSNMGKNIVQNLLALGYQGEILPVGRSGGVVFGHRIYQSLDDIDRKVDLAVILTPASTIASILEQCGRKGIKHVVIESGGFSEMGNEGIPFERECIKIAQQYGIRFIGPNGIGVINMENGLAVPFSPLREGPSLGPVSILSQSGGVGLSYLGFLAEENIGVNKFVSIGNKLNVDENDLLAYLIDDVSTGIILLYLEGFTDGRKFIEVAAQSKKPILVHKSNRFIASANIASSHTAALSADDRLVDYALEQAGCVRVNTMADAIDYVKILTLPPLRGNRLAVVSRSGGHAVIAADACAYYGFDLPPFPKEFLKGIENRLKANVIRLQNPLDLGDLFDLVFYKNIVEEILKREDVDGVVLGHGYARGYEQNDSRKLVTEVGNLVERYQKPVAVFIFSEAVEIDYLKKHSKIPIFSAPENAMSALHFAHQRACMKKSYIEIQSPEAVNLDKAKEIFKNVNGRDHLLLNESIDLLKHYGFLTPDYRLARSQDEALRAWQALRGPVAMKVNRPHFSHKTDYGLVRLGLDSEKDVLAAIEEFRLRVAPKELEVFIQAMVTQAPEVILGGKQDEVFGPVILLGLGGIFVEALGEVIWRVAPIGHHDAKAMLKQIKGQKLFSGIRGESPYDTEALEDLLVRLSHLLSDFPVIQEIDINPVKVGPVGQGAQAVDARVILNCRT